MAVENLGFTAQVGEWAKESEERLLAIFRQSAQDVVDEMQKVGPSVASTRAAAKASPKAFGPLRTGAGGRMPVDTGFLRASLRTSTESPVPIDPEAQGQTPATYDQSATVLAIAGLQIGQTLYATYTAAYAPRVNYGFSGEDSLGRSYDHRGYHFVELAVQRWPTIVEANVAKLRAGGT